MLSYITGEQIKSWIFFSATPYTSRRYPLLSVVTLSLGLISVSHLCDGGLSPDGTLIRSARCHDNPLDPGGLATPAGEAPKSPRNNLGLIRSPPVPEVRFVSFCRGQYYNKARV